MGRVNCATTKARAGCARGVIGTRAHRVVIPRWTYAIIASMGQTITLNKLRGDYFSPEERVPFGHDMHAKRAYQIYEERMRTGRPGTAESDWDEAHTQLFREWRAWGYDYVMSGRFHRENNFEKP